MAEEKRSSDPAVRLLRKIVTNIDAGVPWQQPALQAAFQFKMRNDPLGFEVMNRLMTSMAHDTKVVRHCIQQGLETFEERTGCSTH